MFKKIKYNVSNFVNKKHPKPYFEFDYNETNSIVTKMLKKEDEHKYDSGKFKYDTNSHGLIFYDEKDSHSYQDYTNNKKLITNFSKNKKIFITVSLQFYHTIIDCMGAIFFFNNEFKDVEFYLVFPNFYKKENLYNYDKNNELFQKNLSNNDKLFLDLIKQLNKNNIKYNVINLFNNYILCNNVYIIDIIKNNNSLTFTPHMLDLTSNVLKNNNIINSLNIKNKKIYLSRSNQEQIFDYKNYERQSLYNFFMPNSFSRIDDEKKLENFLVKNFNFEIIDEYFFHNGLEEQIEYINQAKLLMSLSSSGSINMLFLDKTATFIELYCPLTVPPYETYHSHYLRMSNYLDLNYINIPHNRNAQEIIDQINNDKYIYNFLKQ